MRSLTLTTTALLALASAPIFGATAHCIQLSAGLMPFTLYDKGSVRFYYDNASRVSLISYIQPYGDQYACQKISYDAHGMVEQRQIDARDTFWSNTSSSFTYLYDSNNHLVEQEQIYGFTKRNVRYHYDPSGQLSAVRAFESPYGLTELPKERIASRYSEQGALQERTYYDAEGHADRHEEWSYDQQGRVSEQHTYDGGGVELRSSVHYQYGVDGADVKSYYNELGVLEKREYTYYDEHGRIREVACRSDHNELLGVTRYDFNEWSGQLARITDLDGSTHVVGFITIYHDAFHRPYLYEFSYEDLELLSRRVAPYLQLPNDLLE